MKSEFVLFFASVAAALAAPVQQLGDFELYDQHEKPRTYRFPKSKVTIMTVADQKGSAQLARWIEPLYARYEKRIDIEGVADVSMIAAPFRGIFRSAFRKQLTHPVMLDWSGDIVKQFSPQKHVANVYVVDRRGRILKQVSGPVSDSAMREVTREVDRAIAEPPLTPTLPRRSEATSGIEL